MKATEIIKQYSLKYDTASGHYKRESENKNDVVYELIEVNEKDCLLFTEHPLLNGARNVFAVKNDLPALEHWKSDPEKGFICSRCGAQACHLYHGKKLFRTLTPYCHRCGARMDAIDEETDYDDENE